MEIERSVASLIKKHENNYINQLLLYLPASYTKIASSNENNYQKIISGLHKLSYQYRGDDDVEEFFKQIGIELKVWLKLDSGSERFNFIVKNIQKSIEDGVKKVNAQIDNYVTNTKKNAVSTFNKQNKNKDHFEWLKLKNKYPMCEPKLKAKLVQAISDSKNETRIRDRMNDPEHLQKVSLLDESLIVDEYERIKIDYKWGDEDEKLFVANINALKNKFNSTQFLKKCNRFRFISDHELDTLAAEEISRRLDQDNKIYLSRQFLLDKYYSTRDFLTEQQMRFILKTSPMLSKCVDKNFIRSAIKNIEYEDINKLELKIAENIISRFDQIRKAVRESRKMFKQTKNNRIKQRIVEFGAKKQYDIIRQIAREELKKHKPQKYTNCKSQTVIKSKPMNLQSKKRFVPLNQYHPPSGLFVKDCNEQCNDDLFNHYEVNYIEKEKIHNIHQKTPKNSISMVQFYTGGLQAKMPSIPFESISTICQMFKAQFYQKAIRQALQNYQPAIPVVETSHRTQRSNAKQASVYDLDKRPKTTLKIVAEESSESMIKKKIIQNKQKAKAIVYVNKLLVFAAENSFTSFKALNAKYTPEQINTKDHRGNTSLFYASKHQNLQFMNTLLNLGADPSIVCEKDWTALHYIFKTNNINLITKCLTAPKTPNLNALNSDNKTPLAYCTHQILSKLYLQDGVVVVQNRRISFDNNNLLSKQKLQRFIDTFGYQNRINSRIKIN